MQRNALSNKLLDGGSSVVPDPPDKALATCKTPPLNSIRDQHNNAEAEEVLDTRSTASSNTVAVDDSAAHQNGRSRASSSSRGYYDDGGTDSTAAPTDSNGVIEQIERGVYITVVTSPSGKKGIKRIRFR